MNINEKNYEEFLIRHIENDLPENERESLFLFLDQHPEYRRDLELFEQTRLVPDEEISFGERSSLKRSAARFSLNSWLVWSSVAAAALVLIYFQFLSPGSTGVSSIATNQNAGTNKNPDAVTSAGQQASATVNPVTTTNANTSVQDVNSIKPVNSKINQATEKQNIPAANDRQNTKPAFAINSVAPPQNNPESIPAGNNTVALNSQGSNEVLPVATANNGNNTPGNVRLSTMNQIIPAVYVKRKREILVSKVPDVYYTPVAFSGNQSSEQGGAFKDLASIFKAAVDHTPISRTSFYQHSSVGKLLATQVVYEHH